MNARITTLAMSGSAASSRRNWGGLRRATLPSAPMRALTITARLLKIVNSRVNWCFSCVYITRSAVPRDSIDFDEPVEDKKEVDAPIATLEKRSAARNRLHHTEGKDSLSLIWCQPRESLCAPGIGVRRIQRLARGDRSRRPLLLYRHR